MSATVARGRSRAVSRLFVTVILGLLLTAGCTNPPVPDRGSTSWGLPTAVPTPRARDKKPEVALRYVGSRACLACHAEEHRDWLGSHHGLAMQEPDADSVLGDFDSATFQYAGITSTFLRKGEQFWVRTDGPDGKLHEYMVRYVFGVEPLQQVLLELPGGRLQALSIAWDSRRESQGGQRWFHLYPDQAIRAGDPLHWTGRAQNWNHMCADCHSTDVHKNYHGAEGGYDTRFAELNVACEACHGPGSRHLEWAVRGGRGDPELVRLTPPRDRQWKADPTTGSPRPVDPAFAREQVAVCARCHSRRHQFADGWSPGQPLMDAYLPSRLEEDLYFVDGQQKDEVYEYGSFLQSRMFAAGVACTDCHQPHSGKLLAPGKALCLRCHQSNRFDTPKHHHHIAGQPGSSCVECHMPTRTYMQVHARRDHSLRIPDPELSEQLATPDACASCHRAQSAGWAAGAVRGWHKSAGGGPARAVRNRRALVAQTLAAARRGQPGSQQALARLVLDPEFAPIVRATALSLLDPGRGPQALEAIKRALKDPDAGVRFAAIGALEGHPDQSDLLRPLLEDPVRGVRGEAARALASPGEAPEVEARALAVYLEGLARNADLPESHLNHGLVELARGQAREAEEAYRQALRVNSDFAPAFLNLADLFREQGRDSESESLLREGLRRCRSQGQAALLQGLGLLQVRLGRKQEALATLARAHQLLPDEPRMGYIYALALADAGRRPEAVKLLAQVLERHPWDPDAMAAMSQYLEAGGDPVGAARWKARLQKLLNDP